MAVNKMPHLAAIDNSKQLIVDGKPFLVRGVELQNSSFSSAEHMRPIWQDLVDMNVNTVLGSVSWEMIEPVKGTFNFSVIDQIILDARRHGLKLILLWFGTWKNGFSNYVPSWVKLHPEEFPRAEIRSKDGSREVLEVLSPIHQSSADADSEAFSALMQHVKEVDSHYSTVIMVQPENESGLLGDTRDQSDAANKLFQQPVPAALIRFLKENFDLLHPDLQRTLAKHAFLKRIESPTQRNWGEIFGESPATDELFMAYHYALYIERVAQAGKSRYALPMFVNAWQNYFAENDAEAYPVLAGGGDQPGDYPSGGALSTVIDIYHRFAPSLDWCSPDVYFNDYDMICQTYRHRNQPLFIPEQRRDEYGARRIWRAIGSYQAIGVSPFGVDSLPEGEKCAFTEHYRLLVCVSDAILKAQQAPNTIFGFYFDEPNQSGPNQPNIYRAHMDQFEITVRRSFVCGKQGPGYGVVILLPDEENTGQTAKFLLVGAGFQAEFNSTLPDAYFTGILSFEEKHADPSTGELATLRRLNGDETRSGRFAIMPNENPDYDGFPISITIPAKTKIAEVKVYALTKAKMRNGVNGSPLA